MRYIILSVDKFTYKDKITGEARPSCVVYGLSDKGTVIKPFFTASDYEKFGFDEYVLNKADVDSIYKSYKSCNIDFNERGDVVAVAK